MICFNAIFVIRYVLLLSSWVLDLRLSVNLTPETDIGILIDHFWRQRKWTHLLPPVCKNIWRDFGQLNTMPGDIFVDEEKVSNACKAVTKNLKRMYKADIPLNSSFGRRVDLILASKGTELSTSEWKKKKCPFAKCLQQQAKKHHNQQGNRTIFFWVSLSLMLTRTR